MTTERSELNQWCEAVLNDLAGPKMEPKQSTIDELEQIVEAHHATELRKVGWQPIETLPTQGGPFLIYWPMTMVGHAEMDMCSYAEYSQIVGFGESPATHWMPLPSPPAIAPASTEQP